MGIEDFLKQEEQRFIRENLMSDEVFDFIRENTMPFNELMAYYRCTIMEVETKFKVLNEQFSLQYDRNPIETIKTRIKSTEGIIKKANKKNIPFTMESIEQNIRDIAGIRVICSFTEDIYMLADCLLHQDDITLIEKKDYIKNPKESGYRSLHLIIEIPIFLQNEKRRMKVENDMLHPAPRAPKTIAAVHDISCYGRCSMQAVWPVLSHYGHLVCPLPTALLSTHTGGFDHFTFLDLGGEMKKILASWREEGLRFDAVYSGFLGSAGQIGTVLSLIEDQPGALVLVDPVMGDCGEIYKTYTPEMCELMHRLCARADIITPNLPEACLLAGVPYDPEPDDAAVDALLGRLDGVEIDHPRNTPEDRAELTRLAKENGLIVTGGTDYHGINTVTPRPVGAFTTGDEMIARIGDIAKARKSTYKRQK